MIKINLLPIKEIKQRLARRREFFMFVGSIVVVLVILALVSLVISGRAAKLEAQIKDLEDEKATYTAIQREINELKRSREEIEVKIDTIEQLQVDAQLTVRILDEISNLTPSSRMWLNSLRIADNTVNLAGVGLDNPTIAQYMQALEGSPFFGSADLTSSSRTEMEGQSLNSFSLVLRITPPPQETEEE